MNANREETLEAGDFRVRFLWRGDRYAHEIWLLNGAEWVRALESVEGSPEEDWPASPPFQSIAVERRDDGRMVAMLVGMAGKSHWSASAQLDPRGPGVSFDVACRVRDGHCGPLGSAYRSHTSRFDALGIEPAGELGPARLARDGAIVRIAVPVSEDAGPRTIRWGYRLGRAGSQE